MGALDLTSSLTNIKCPFHLKIFDIEAEGTILNIYGNDL